MVNIVSEFVPCIKVGLKSVMRDREIEIIQRMRGWKLETGSSINNWIELMMAGKLRITPNPPAHLSPS